MMEGWYLVTFTLLLTLVNLGQGQDQDPCTFPSMLTKRSRWETQMVLERRRTNVFYKFHPNKLEIRDYETEEKRTVTYTCHAEKNDNTFVLKFDQFGREKFICMQFVSRSERVLQRKISRVQFQLTDDICDNLDLDDWPLVWPNMDGQYSECPFEGGYEIDLRTYMHDVPLCGSMWLKPRLESECIKGEGLNIDFRNFECRGDLGMRLLQKLMCLGTWEDGNYVFTILTDHDELWPKLWLLRLPREVRADGAIHGVLSKDIMADHGQYYGSNGRVPLERVYEMRMTTEEYPSLCENEAHECGNQCGGPNEMYCKKDCGACEPALELNTCTFTKETQGEWREYHDEGVRGITVTDSILYTEDLIPFQCYELYPELLYEGRKAMVTVFKNGCKPRFTCVEFQKKASDVVGYRLSQSLVWPATIEASAGQVCADERFQKDPEPLFDKYRSQKSKILIKKTPEHESVPCNLETSVGLSGLAKDGKRLLGVLWNSVIGSEGQSQGDSHTILHETCPDASTPHSSRTLRCLASYRPFNDTQFLIVEEEGNEENVECWVIHTYLWERRPRALVLSPAHCSHDMPIRIDFMNDTHYHSKYEVLELEAEAMDPCSEWKSNAPQPPTSPQITIAPPKNTPKAPMLTPIGPDASSTIPVTATLTPPVNRVAPEGWKIKVGGVRSGQTMVAGKLWLVAAMWFLVKIF